eukprot:CAMPEP_0178436618 /NCGR_PEP_ID=MMETSP0689_2-20121128/34534_1 /TAXON_ID=160604 /ORGANISM="Amphidinium massartii, Strain CS-259" /LENGTH=91 /DNA_ID=CAMNT_0020058723 /DNA_START=742 /DNA_END=1018 /DNA_ORIENTATION=+
MSGVTTSALVRQLTGKQPAISLPPQAQHGGSRCLVENLLGLEVKHAQFGDFAGVVLFRVMAIPSSGCIGASSAGGGAAVEDEAATTVAANG